MRYTIASLGATSLAHRQPLNALCHQPQPLPSHRLSSVSPQTCRSPCFWPAGHVHFAPSPTVPFATAVSPSSLELAWQPSWRPSRVAQGPGQRASGRLTCGRKILDSINMMACKCRVTLSILSRFHSHPPHRLAAIPCPSMQTHIDCCP